MARLILCSAVLVFAAPSPEDDPAIARIQGLYRKDVTRADADHAGARQRAVAKRNKSLQELLEKATRAGDFDRATAIKGLMAVDEAGHERPKALVRFGTSEYAVISESATWNVAKRICEEMGGHLACLETPEEAAFIARLCRDPTTWVGASDEETEGRWTWVNGVEAKTTGWSLDNGNGDQHALAIVQGGSLLDGNQGTRFPYVCEWER